MTTHELKFHPAHNHHCRILLSDGSTLSGVYGAFFSEEPEQLYLVRSSDLHVFRPFLAAKDEPAMRSYCQPLDPTTVRSVELIA